MRTTLDLPDELFRRAKITAVERGLSLRELVIVALGKDLGMEGGRRPARLDTPPITLAADAPLRNLSPQALKDLDNEDLTASDQSRAHAGDC